MARCMTALLSGWVYHENATVYSGVLVTDIRPVMLGRTPGGVKPLALVALAAWLLWAALPPVSLQAAQPGALEPNGPVNDFANVIDPATRAALLEQIRRVEHDTSAEIAVATVTSLDGTSIEDYANRLFHEWGIGQKGVDNGVLVLVVPSERRVRIEVGYGLEPILPDGLAGEIIRRQMTPRFRDGDYSGGIRDAVARLDRIIRAKHVLTAAERQALVATAGTSGADWGLVLVLSGLAALVGSAIGASVRARAVSRLIFPVLVLGALLYVFLLLDVPWGLFVALPLVAAATALTLRLTGRARWRGRRWAMPSAGSGSGYSSSGSDDSSGSSSSSSSSDSFGGGDSGGGGASGSW